MDTQTPSFTGKAIVLAAFLVGLGIFASGAARAHSESELNELQHSLSITGSAMRTVTSDSMKWSLNLRRQTSGTSASGTTMMPEQQLKADIDKVLSLLDAAGVHNPTVSRQPFQNTSYGGGYGYGYEDSSSSTGGTQTVVIESSQVKEMNAATANIVSTLTREGINIDSNQTEFFLTKRNDIRRELFTEAMEDARKQAAAVNGGKQPKLIRLDSGAYLQITPVSGGSGYYYGGSEDTSSVDKRVNLDVTGVFSLK